MTDKKLPTPEEIQKEFEEFVRNRFGGQVQVFSQMGHPPHGTSPDQTATEEADNSDQPALDVKVDIENFQLKPKDIKDHLDRFVIKQDDAKKALAIAVCDHYNHVKQCLNEDENSEREYSKQNVLVLGPTGVGKTYLVKQIAKQIGVPFVKADATRFSETGYVGSNVDDMVRDLVSQVNGNIDAAQYGIIYIDEIDKLACSTNGYGGRDVTGRGVQSGLLKLMEETDIDLSSGNDMRSQMQAFMEFQQKGKMSDKIINTKHILFIVSGAFTGLEDVIKQRLNQNDIGFSASQNRSSEEDAWFKHASTEDLVEYGFEPEFIGRLPIRVACQHLEVADLYEILATSEGSIIRQYENAFRAYGIDVQFSDAALHRIAEKAYNQKTGARALMTVCEEALRAFKYELPSAHLKEFTVTPQVIDEPLEELEKLLQQPAYNERLAQLNEINAFENDFATRHEMQIEFSDEAAEKICELADKTSRDPSELCTELLQSYEHGLKLIRQNTGKTKFVLEKSVVENPQGSLERMIRESYRRQKNDASDQTSPSL
jgi:endopeptidase Clp ATP-binding regulatory subunit ClpX